MNDHVLAQNLLTYFRGMGATDTDSIELIVRVIAYRHRTN